MTLENSLKVEIGDTLIADYNNGIWGKDDICILIEKSPEYEKCTDKKGAGLKMMIEATLLEIKRYS